MNYIIIVILYTKIWKFLPHMIIQEHTFINLRGRP